MIDGRDKMVGRTTIQGTIMGTSVVVLGLGLGDLLTGVPLYECIADFIDCPSGGCSTMWCSDQRISKADLLGDISDWSWKG